jgi:AraC-like DNA-binding protein
MFRYDELEITNCVGDASKREAIARSWPAFEAHFQVDGAYFVHYGSEPQLVDVHHVELRRAGMLAEYSRPMISVDQGLSIRFSVSRLQSFPIGVVRVGSRAFAELRALRWASLDARAEPDQVRHRADALVSSIVRAAQVEHSGVSVDDRRSARRQRAVERARVFLVERAYERPSLVDAAAVADYAPFHFARVFRAEVGMSPHRYLSELRLRQAVARLDAGAVNLTSLALDLGYSSQSHFTTAFRARFGCTPGAFRR